MAQPSIPPNPDLADQVQAGCLWPCLSFDASVGDVGQHFAVGAVDLSHRLFRQVPGFTAVCEDGADGSAVKSQFQVKCDHRRCKDVPELPAS